MNVPDEMKKKLRELPDKPGCYILRDRRGAIVYVGRAESLKKRVGSYFRHGTLRSADPKLRGLINSAVDVDAVIASNMAEAVLTEGRLIKAYRPRYNTFFKDDKRFLMLKANMKRRFPRFELCRIRKNDNAAYFGPYASMRAARATLEFIEKHFGIRRCRSHSPGVRDHKHCINDIVRFCSAPCIGKTSEAEYRRMMDEACAFLRGERPETLCEVEAEMQAMRRSLDFEKAAAMRDLLRHLRCTVRQRARVARSPAADRKEALAGIRELRDVLGLKKTPRLIEACDVSCISGMHAVSCVVVAEDGVVRPNRYRRFRVKTVDAADDSRMMAETVRRRFERILREKGSMPDLLLVDGGAVQLRAAETELSKLGLSRLPAAGLAKQFEQVYVSDWPSAGATPGTAGRIRVITLPPHSPALNVIKRLRDEAHRFALDFHRRLRGKKIRESVLDEIPGLGEKRKVRLLRRFGSVTRLAKAETEVIASVPGIGPKTAEAIRSALNGCAAKDPGCNRSGLS